MIVGFIMGWLTAYARAHLAVLLLSWLAVPIYFLYGLCPLYPLKTPSVAATPAAQTVRLPQAR